jgi:DNA repair exonuclease SbcCD ATPase subunit
MRSCHSLLIFCLAACFVGCSKPQETIIPVDTKLWDKELMPQIRELSESDRQYVRSYFARLAPDGISGPNRVPPGTSLGEAIADQKRFEEQSRLYEAQREKARLDAEIQRMREQQEEGRKALQGSIEDAQKRLSTINTGIADVEKGIRDANASITALAPQIERFKLTADLADQIPKIRENLDALASATQRATDAAISHAGDLQERLARVDALVASLEQRMQKQKPTTPKQTMAKPAHP